MHLGKAPFRHADLPAAVEMGIQIRRYRPRKLHLAVHHAVPAARIAAEGLGNLAERTVAADSADRERRGVRVCDGNMQLRPARVAASVAAAQGYVVERYRVADVGI